jgi:hypothetical protein
MKHFLSILMFATFVSCKSLVKTTYGMNKNIEFKSQQEYENYVFKKYKIKAETIYYSDAQSFSPFLSSVVEKKVDYFYGIFQNDSLELRRSSNLLANQSCSARVLHEINTAKIDGDSSVTVNNIFKKLTFLNLSSHEKLNLTRGKKHKVILVFSYKAGLVRKDDFERVERLLSSMPDYELIVISLDRIDRLKS